MNLFRSMDKYTKFFIITAVLIAIATPFISSQYQNFRPEAALDNSPSIDDFYSSKTYISTIYPPAPFTLTWKTSFAGYCNAAGAWTGRKSSNGSETLTMTLDLARIGPTYTLTCYGNNGQVVSKSILVMTPSNTVPAGQGGIAGGPCNPFGDVDANGYISAVDAQRVLRIVAGFGMRPTDSERRRADVDNNGTVTSVDSQKILRLIAGLDNNTFPVCGKPF